MHTASSERSLRSTFSWDAESFKVDSLIRSFRAMMPRIQVNMSSWRVSMPPLAPHLPRLLFLFVIFVAATSCIVFMLSTLPLKLPKHIAGLTLVEIKEFALSLKEYAASSPKARTHTLLVMGAFFTWKQSFTVPGSLIMNVVFGAMYGTYFGTFYTSLLTAVGGVFCYLLSAPLAPFITSLPGLAKPLDAMRRALSPGRAHAPGRSVMISNSRGSGDANLWSYLLILRVLPIVPYGLMNIACGVLGVPLTPYALTLAVGSIPWNFVTCQVGDILQEIVEAIPLEGGAGGGMREITKHIWNRDMIIKLVLLSAASLLPMVLSRYLKRDKGYEAVSPEDDEENERHTMAEQHTTHVSARAPHTREGTDHNYQSAWL